MASTKWQAYLASPAVIPRPRDRSFESYRWSQFPIDDEAHLPRNARGEEARLREKPQEPAKIKAVGPIGNGDLVARDEKSERRANAMNDRPITQPLYYITSELFPAARCQCRPADAPAAFPNISRNVDASCRSLGRKVPSVRFP